MRRMVVGLILQQKQIKTVSVRKETTTGTNGEGPRRLLVAKIAGRIEVSRAKVVRVFVEQCTLQLVGRGVSVQFLKEVCGQKGNMATS